MSWTRLMAVRLARLSMMKNKRRAKIMEQWAACWLAHLRQWPCELPAQTVTKNPKRRRELREKLDVTKIVKFG